jgi:hypothetical protein
MNAFVPSRRLLRCLAALLGLSSAAASAQILNGDFESGNLSGWTLGGQNHAAAVKSSNFNPGPLAAPGGTYMAALSNGSGSLSNTTYDVDGNSTNDYDMTSMSQTFTFTSITGTAYLSFDWNFPTSEQDQPNQYDDVFDVQTTVGSTTSRLFSGSSCKNNNASYSPFPNVPCFTSTVQNWSIVNASPISGTTLRYGVGQFQHACVAIPNLSAGSNTLTLTFRVADQSDNQYDSVLLLDNLAIAPNCSGGTGQTITQLTHSVGSRVEQKGVGLVFTPTQNSFVQPGTDATGTAVAFVSNDNYTGDNPNALQQVYVYDNGSFTRATNLAMGVGGEVQGVSLSDTLTGGRHGRYVAIAAKLTAAADQQIYRWDRQTGTVTTVTSSSGCSNTNPTISSTGTRIAWETTCNAYTGRGTTKKIVYSDFSSSWATPTNFMSAGTPAASCTGAAPSISRGDGGNVLVFVSDCRWSGSTPSTGEIYRYVISSNTFKRLTTSPSGTTGVHNNSPSTDAVTGTGNSGAGRYTYFLSDLDLGGSGLNDDGSMEIFRYDNSSSTLKQVTNLQATGAYLSVHMTSDTSGSLFGYEYIDVLSGLTDVGVGDFNGTSVTLTPVAHTSFSMGVNAGAASGAATLSFIAPDDLVSGQNSDGNFEVFSSQVQ